MSAVQSGRSRTPRRRRPCPFSDTRTPRSRWRRP